MSDDVQTWEAAGVRVQLIPSRPEVKVQPDSSLQQTQRWLPPHVSLTYLAAPSFEEPAAVLAVIDALAAAGLALEDALADYHSGVLL